MHMGIGGPLPAEMTVVAVWWLDTQAREPSVTRRWRWAFAWTSLVPRHAQGDARHAQGDAKGDVHFAQGDTHGERRTYCGSEGCSYEKLGQILP